MCVYVCMHTYVHTCTHAHIQCMYRCTWTHVCVYLLGYLSICAHICMYAHFVCIYVYIDCFKLSWFVYGCLHLLCRYSLTYYALMHPIICLPVSVLVLRFQNTHCVAHRHTHRHIDFVSMFSTSPCIHRDTHTHMHP